MDSGYCFGEVLRQRQESSLNRQGQRLQGMLAGEDCGSPEPRSEEVRDRGDWRGW